MSIETTAEETTDEATAEELDAAFARGLNRDRSQAAEPAAETTAPEPGPVAEAAAEPQQEVVEDEPAALSPQELRAMKTELEALKQAAAQVPTLEHRLRSAEGRVAALQKQAPAAPPPAPPRLEKVERVRSELPEVIEAMEEMFQSREPKVEPIAEPEPESTPTLDAEAPGWQDKVFSTEFQAWLNVQDPAYREKVKLTNNEGVLLSAITRFDVQQQATAATRQAAAAQVAQTRQIRVAAAVTPQGAGRRAPSTKSLEDFFADGLNRRHRA